MKRPIWCHSLNVPNDNTPELVGYLRRNIGLETSSAPVWRIEYHLLGDTVLRFRDLKSRDLAAMWLRVKVA